LYPDHAGSIYLQGEEVKMRDPRAALEQGVAVIYQEFALAPDLTVSENIALGREMTRTRLGGISHKALEARSASEAAALEIELPMNARVSDLGVAQQQMTEIVKAIARKARILVMDEPTARLSGRERARLFDMIRNLSKQGVGIVYVSHFLEEVFEVASRVTILRDGRRVASQPLKELTIPTIARLMLGEKFDSLAGNHASRARPTVSDTVPFSLELEDVAVGDAVAPTTLSLRRGEILGLAGLEGSGRSVLAKSIVGAERGTSGRLKVHGRTGLFKNPTRASDRGVVLLPADRKVAGMLMVRSVAENVEVTALRRRLGKFGFYRSRAAAALVRRIIQVVSLRPDDPAMIVGSLSGGNQQKVALARALAAEASVLVLDQPTAGVDIGAKADLYAQLDRFTEAGGSALLVSDDLDELLRLSDRIALMRHGVADRPKMAAEYDRIGLLEAINAGPAG